MEGLRLFATFAPRSVTVAVGQGLTGDNVVFALGRQCTTAVTGLRPNGFMHKLHQPIRCLRRRTCAALGSPASLSSLAAARFARAQHREPNTPSPSVEAIEKVLLISTMQE